MVKINTITTKSGDAGQTMLANGAMMAKDDPLVALLGQLDLLNVIIGRLRIHSDKCALGKQLLALQNRLFDLGAWLALANNFAGITDSDTKALEMWTSGLIADLPELTSFVIPVSDLFTAESELARTHCRIFEQSLAVYFKPEKPHASTYKEAEVTSLKKFINRLSDYFFAISWQHNSPQKKHLWQQNKQLNAD